MTLSPEAMAIAERQAAEDRGILARLRRAGTVRRAPTGNEQPGFVRQIEALAFPPVNLAIRPNTKKAKKRRR